MASPYASRIDSARERLNETVAETETGKYCSPDGKTSVDGLSLRVQRADVHSTPGKIPGESSEAATGKIFVRAAELVLTPQKGGRFVIGGLTTWTIENSPTLTNLQWSCNVKRMGVDSIGSRKAEG